MNYNRAMTASPSEPKAKSSLQKWHKILCAFVLVCVLGSILVTVIASPDFRDTIGEFFVTLSDEPGITIRKDVAYYQSKAPDARQPNNTFNIGDLYLPETEHFTQSSGNAKQLRPAVVVVHGGSWCMGSKNDLPESMIARYFAKHGMVAFSINYRLLDHGGEFPNDVVDVKRAIDFIREHAQEWNVDPEKIVVTGTSSGATAAMMAAYTPDDGLFAPDSATKSKTRELPICAVLSFYGPTNFEQLSTNTYLKRYLQPAPGTYEQKLKQCSPITYANSAVATFFAHGTVDENVPLQQSVDLARLLTERKIPCEFVKIEGAGHFVGGASRALVLDRMLSFLQRRFAEKPLQSSSHS